MVRVLSQRKHTTLYFDDETPSPTVLKVLNDEYPTPEQLSRFYHEHAITSSLEHPGVRKSLGQTRFKNRYAIRLEYIEGTELAEQQLGTSLDLHDFLTITCQIVTQLDTLHQQHIIHRDIKPENILLRQHPTDNNPVVLIDFGLASRLDLKHNSFDNARKLEGTLAYLSPEQTGRMNRTVDYRSDYYALGATLYTIVAGHPPFVSSDPMELIYNHLVRTPTLLHELTEDCPEALSRIIDKLLAKAPEERYQSAAGLLADLQQCQTSLHETGSIASFRLGQHDHSGRFTLPEKLYGRQREQQQCRESLAQLSLPGAKMLTITGPAGAGKSALVEDQFQAITTHKGTFARGKCEQLQHAIPFLPFRQACSELLHALMTEPEHELNAWRTALSQRLGQLGGALLPVIPQLSLLLGPLPEPPALDSAAAQARLLYLMRQFVQVMSPPTRPLVLFLDDLQWADFASLELLSTLLHDPESGHLLIIAAYRDNEVEQDHRLLSLLNELQDNHVQHITLTPLTPSDIANMLTDAMGQPIQDDDPLTDIIAQKTSGNALFVRSFLRLLTDNQLLTYQRDTHQWTWDNTQINQLKVADVVADLLVEQIHELTPHVQEIMQYAACMGNRFSLSMLAKLLDQPITQLVHDLEDAIDKGLLHPIGQQHRMVDAADELHMDLSLEYRFVHDKIQQAAVSMLPPDKQSQWHWRIGQCYFDQADQTEPSIPTNTLFAMVHHLNLGKDHATDDTARLQLATWNLEAGRLATQAGVFQQAIQHCETGLALLPTTPWKSQYTLTLGLHLTLAEAASLAMSDERVKEVAHTVLQHAQSHLDKARAYDAMAMVDMAREDLGGAIQLGLKALEELGTTFPKRPILPHIILGLLRTQRTLKGRIEELADLPPLQDPQIRAVLSLLERLMPAAFRSGSNYFPLFVFELVRLSSIHGNSRHSAFGYASFAIAQCAVLSKYDHGYRFAQLAKTLGKQYPDIGHLFIFNTFIRHWREPLASIPAHMARDYRTSLEAGNMYQGTWLAGYRLLFMFIQGTPLPTIVEQCEQYKEALLWDEGTQSVRLMLLQCATQLTTTCHPPHQLEGDHYNEAYVRKRYDTQNDATEIGEYHIMSMLLALLFDNGADALSHADEVEQYTEGLNPMPFFPLMHLYCGLVRLDASQQQPSWSRTRAIKRHLKTLKRLSKEGPNYTHFAPFLQAEWHRHTNKHAQAATLYAESIRIANQQQAPIQQRGLIFQRAALFHEQLGHDEIAQAYWRHAMQCYREWGATELLDTWHAKRPHYLHSLAQPGHSPSLTTTTITTQNRHTSSTTFQIDLQTLWKASAALSAEIVTDKLLQRLLSIMVENAGAQRGALLLLDNQTHTTPQLAALFDNQTVQLIDENSNDEDDIPVCQTIVQYVARTRSALLLHNAQQDERFGKLPYIQSHAIRSVLCAPITHQGRDRAIVYLENNALAGAFPPERLELVTLLCAQAGTALENAQLYGALEEKVAERTRELKDAMAQLVQSEKMASLGTLVAGVAHELNNPANFTYSGASNLRRRLQDLQDAILGDAPDQESLDLFDQLTAPLKNNIESIEEGAQRIKSIVTGLRTFSRLDESQYKEIELVDNIEATLGLMQARYNAHVTFETAFVASPSIWCRPADLNQVFMNVLLNACQAIEERRQHEDLHGHITISTNETDDTINICFQDNGCGIPEGIQDRIFEPFFTTKQVGSGAGLGLSTAFGIIEKHNGTIQITSTENKGTDVTITLPRHPSHPQIMA